ncbi:MAG: nuclear transport factor 2 family protein [Planctomycetaceae bacterium]
MFISQKDATAAMETDPSLSAIAAELDSMHASARQAFCARDIDAYRTFFTEDLRYIQADGKQINRDELLRHVRKQLSQFKTVDSEMTRESIAVNNNGTATPILNQTGIYTLSVFVFFTRTWNINRRGKYTYRKTDGRWQICHVEVFSETVN